MATTLKAKRIGPSRYAYRGYEIREIGREQGMSVQWLISCTDDDGNDIGCEYQTTLRQAKVRIDQWSQA